MLNNICYNFASVSQRGEGGGGGGGVFKVVSKTEKSAEMFNTLRCSCLTIFLNNLFNLREC